MAENSKIEWTDHTFNPWRGCTKVSPGCAHCYAETLSKRNPKVLGEWGPGRPRVLASEEMWRTPLKWNREAGVRMNNAAVIRGNGISSNRLDEPERRPRVFCASLADWLDEEVPVKWLARLLGLIYETPNLDWLLLTKRPQNWEERHELATSYLMQTSSAADSWAVDWMNGYAPENVWMGTTVEDQVRADERVPELLKIPARVRFLSCEPLLGPVDFVKAGAFWSDLNGVVKPEYQQTRTHINWVICGGESGPKARPMHPDWARGLRDQCAAAGVPFLFKQWGEWVYPQYADPSASFDDFPKAARGQVWTSTGPDSRKGYDLLRLGKKAAGRLLDGREWSEFPKVRG
ncbi:phage Gp37/Gp68 family protein [Prosthecobacter sp.]|uniref:phage Gp37/Gp68 family protein n=1 Tax=Prosthecobacter sp. TaxID=1965333 RepID=UPI0037842DEB